MIYSIQSVKAIVNLNPAEVILSDAKFTRVEATGTTGKVSSTAYVKPGNALRAQATMGHVSSAGYVKPGNALNTHAPTRKVSSFGNGTYLVMNPIRFEIPATKASVAIGAGTVRISSKTGITGSSATKRTQTSSMLYQPVFVTALTGTKRVAAFGRMVVPTALNRGGSIKRAQQFADVFIPPYEIRVFSSTKKPGTRSDIQVPTALAYAGRAKMARTVALLAPSMDLSATQSVKKVGSAILLNNRVQADLSGILTAPKAAIVGELDSYIAIRATVTGLLPHVSGEVEFDGETSAGGILRAPVPSIAATLKLAYRINGSLIAPMPGTASNDLEITPSVLTAPSARTAGFIYYGIPSRRRTLTVID